MHNIPNIISLLRAFLVLPIGVYLYQEAWGSAFILIFIAGISDAFDGYLARVNNWQSRLGSILDPLADKLLLVVIFIILAYKGKLPHWLMILVVSRDIIILIGAMVYQWITKELKMTPLFSSKVNTALQILFILMIMVHLAILPLPDTLLSVMQTIVAITTFVSGVFYIICWSGYCAKYLAEQKEK